MAKDRFISDEEAAHNMQRDFEFDKAIADGVLPAGTRLADDAEPSSVVVTDYLPQSAIDACSVMATIDDPGVHVFASDDVIVDSRTGMAFAKPAADATTIVPSEGQ